MPFSEILAKILVSQQCLTQQAAPEKFFLRLSRKFWFHNNAKLTQQAAHEKFFCDCRENFGFTTMPN